MEACRLQQLSAQASNAQTVAGSELKPRSRARGRRDDASVSRGGIRSPNSSCREALAAFGLWSCFLGCLQVECLDVWALDWVL